MRVVLSKIQILGLVVLSNQIDHDIRVANAVTDRFLVERMERNRIHFTNISRLFRRRTSSPSSWYGIIQVTL